MSEILVVVEVAAAGARRVVAGDDVRSAFADAHALNNTTATTAPTLEYVP